MNALKLAAASLALVFGGAGPASAGELLGGVYDHDADINIALGGFEPGAQIGLGYRTNPIEALRPVGRPLAYANAMINTAGATSYLHAGLGWRFGLGERLYVLPAIGAAVHNGNEEAFQATSDELYLGSRVLFAPELNLGWKLNERASIEASLIHLSHGQTRGRQNPGLDDIGVRLAWKLGGG